MGVEVPERAEYLRTIWHEMSRIHSHMLWLGLAADGFGFESLFMHCWRVRERILDLFEETTGGRVIFSVCKVGGVKKDMSKEMLDKIVAELRIMEKETKALADTFIEDTSVKNRLVGVGVITKAEAEELGMVGPFARASGVRQDLRLASAGVYDKLGFEPILETAGDCYARALVRVREVYQSIDMIEKAVEQIPDGDIEVPVKGNLPNGEFVGRLEQPRGEAFYYSKGAGTKFLERMRVRTPTNANIPGMVKALAGCDLADVPMIVLTIDPCISCTER